MCKNIRVSAYLCKRNTGMINQKLKRLVTNRGERSRMKAGLRKGQQVWGGSLASRSLPFCVVLSLTTVLMFHTPNSINKQLKAIKMWKELKMQYRSPPHSVRHLQFHFSWFRLQVDCCLKILNGRSQKQTIYKFKCMTFRVPH